MALPRLVAQVAAEQLLQRVVVGDEHERIVRVVTDLCEQLPRARGVVGGRLRGRRPPRALDLRRLEPRLRLERTDQHVLLGVGPATDGLQLVYAARADGRSAGGTH